MDKFFDEFSDKAQKLGALAAMLLACGAFSIYTEPSRGAFLPRLFYTPLRLLFGAHNVCHVAGSLGVIMGAVLVVILALRGFITPLKKSCYGLLMLIANIYAFGLLFDVVFGDTSRLLQGGIPTMIAVAAYALSVLGMRQYVPLALTVLASLCVINIMFADSVLFIPGAIGILLIIASVFLQCDNIWEKFRGSFTLDIRGK